MPAPPRVPLAMSLALLGACGGAPAFVRPEAGAAADAAVDAPADVLPSSDVQPVPIEDAAVEVPAEIVVYAHTASTLYSVDPRTFALREIAPFRWPSGTTDNEMTDLAVTGDGQIWGVTRTVLYRVDAATAACTQVARIGTGLGMSFNALTFLPGDLGRERLVGATREGAYYEVDTTSGAVRRLGSYTDPSTRETYRSAGDIVSVDTDLRLTYATVEEFDGTEWLARIDPDTGAVTPVGRTGRRASYGLGFWGGRLFGFGDDGWVSRIDARTGTATAVFNRPVSWWGAGVSTRAPIVPPG